MLNFSMMFYMLFGTALVTTQLKSKTKRVGMAAVFLSAAAALICIAVSFFSDVKFYDTWIWWLVTESAVALTLIVCQCISLRKATNARKFVYLVGITALFTFIVDLLSNALGWWEGGYASKIVFLAIFIIALVVVLRIVPSHINAAKKARELEAEKQALKLELQESRISIMLSQMKWGCI